MFSKQAKEEECQGRREISRLAALVRGSSLTSWEVEQGLKVKSN